MRVLGPGDPCPCCGQPIQTSERLALLTLSLMAEEMPNYEWPQGREEASGHCIYCFECEEARNG